MPIEIRMPALSPTMTEGNIARWLKKEGDEVHSGDVIAEIETDKATMEYEAVDEGRIGKIIVPEGAQGVKVNQPIAVLLEEGEDAGALAGFAEQGGGAPAAPPKPVEPPPVSAAPKTEETPISAAPSAPVTPLPRANGANGADHRIFASPLARRMAHHAGLDLAAIRGSGPQGRIVKADIEVAVAGVPLAPQIAPQATPRPAPSAPLATVAPALAKDQIIALAGDPPFIERPHTAMRRVIARRLSESKQTIPHFYMSVDCTIDELLAIRTRLNAKSESN